MPSPFSSSESLEDARQVAAGLGIRLDVLEIGDVFAAHLDALRGTFGDGKTGVAEENLQARIRGNLLMAISNRFGSMVLATGNKSEYAVGYATLYGDMAGGSRRSRTSRRRSCTSSRGGGTPLGRPSRRRSCGGSSTNPSAELRPDQKDTDTLPPYDVLDLIVEAYVEDDRAPEDIIAERGLDPKLVDRVVEMIDRAEYKRRQAAPGIKITPKAFGRDRRLPITNRYRRFRSP